MCWKGIDMSMYYRLEVGQTYWDTFFTGRDVPDIARYRMAQRLKEWRGSGNEVVRMSDKKNKKSIYALVLSGNKPIVERIEEIIGLA